MAWTAVMAVVFVQRVAAHLTMPTFSIHVLVLLGVSSVTFLGSEHPDAR